MKARGAERPHGTRLKYRSGCHCVKCRAANSRYECGRLAERAKGNSNELVPVQAVREHLKTLSSQGVGVRAVAAASDVGKTILKDIVAGRRLHIRRQSELRVLAVDGNARADRALIDARQTWKLLDSLIDRGYTKRQLAKWCGWENGVIQLSRRKITAISGAKVERMYNLVEAGKLRRD